MSKAIDAAVAVLHVIKEIIKSYLADDANNALYNIQELPDLLNSLSSEKIRSLKLHFNDAFIRYGTPLPIRPHYAELYHARIKLILELKKLPLNIDVDHRQEITDALFLDTLSDALQKKSFDFSQMTHEQVDSLVHILETEFRTYFIRRINILIEESIKKITTLYAIETVSPEINNIFDNSNERMTSIPFAFSKVDGRTSSMSTFSLFPTPTKTIKVNTVYDSDDGEVEEIITGLNEVCL